MKKSKKSRAPKILCLDIETSPIEAYVWGLWDNNVALNQIKEDWFVISWAAKWVGEKKVFQEDLRHTIDKKSDKDLLKKIWKLMDEADIVLTQNGKSFDVKKLNARFKINKMQPPSSFRQIDTRALAKKHFGFTSNKLEYMTDKINTKYKKLQHKDFPGQELWTECLNSNQKAWKSMAKYNIFDVLSTEELYTQFIPWDNTVNFNMYSDPGKTVCTCGNTKFLKNGIYYTPTGGFQRYRCTECGSEMRSRKSILTKPKLTGTVR